ncbi:MAG: hypothetical protein WDN44_06790 [Sphingomonas sp.]
MADAAVIATLRATLSAMEKHGLRRRPVLPLGMGAIDGQLADKGLRLDALHEVTGGRPRSGR